VLIELTPTVCQFSTGSRRKTGISRSVFFKVADRGSGGAKRHALAHHLDRAALALGQEPVWYLTGLLGLGPPSP
jgi:hypothetical protein